MEKIGDSMGGSRWKLAPGSQVRKEDFGLLFYQMRGPRLYFVSSGGLLEDRFFQGELTLEQWLVRKTGETRVSESQILDLELALGQLKEKGVILGC